MILETLEDGWGSAFGFAADGSSWATTSIGALHLRTGGASRLVGLDGFVAGAPQFTDDAVLAGTRRVPLDGGDPARVLDLLPALTSDMAPEARPPAQQFPAQLVEWAPSTDRVAALGVFQPSRGLGAVDTYGGPPGRVVLADSEGAQVAVLEPDTGPLTDRVIAFGADVVTIGSGSATAFETDTGAVIGDPLPSAKGRALGIAVSDGGVVALTRTQGEAIVWSPRDSTTPIEWQAHAGGGRAAAWHPGGTLATGGDDLKVVLWELGEAPSPRATFEVPGEVYGLAFHPTEAHLYVAHQFPERGITVLDVADWLT